jgi:hypothetical protein
MKICIKIEKFSFSLSHFATKICCVEFLSQTFLREKSQPYKLCVAGNFAIFDCFPVYVAARRESVEDVVAKKKSFLLLINAPRLSFLIIIQQELLIIHHFLPISK